MSAWASFRNSENHRHDWEARLARVAPRAASEWVFSITTYQQVAGLSRALYALSVFYLSSWGLDTLLVFLEPETPIIGEAPAGLKGEPIHSLDSNVSLAIRDFFPR
ncbi:hypothetical protein F1559_003495 [Cyanidiococcus yangmingshanensis]|uniref:Uncharacterized protein n=1 Tax=Cyanidiococcus yangmingshanensis TaxID=2690220 RepID=A0A7J7INA4_9RHOD|nr:hypothetical protein F1559_003495 [Cyanidiococcus yangmingshanensis]